MDIQIVRSNIPFLWKGRQYQIVDAGIKSNQPYATVNPSCPELIDMLCSRLSKDKGLVVYLGNGYCCFPEDRK
ncbi:MAG: hypothetical protein ABIS30_04560 [Gallionella sp.]|jgi:hypothetical protein